MKLLPVKEIPHDSFSTDDGFETVINDEYPAEEDADQVRDWIIDFNYGNASCPYCNTNLDSQTYERGSFDDGDWGRFAHLSECENCAYWHCFVNQFSDHHFMTSSVGWYAWISKVQEFDQTLPSGCSSELAQGLRQHRLSWDALEPAWLERLVADVFKANHKQADVFHVGRPNDGGVDVIFVDSGTKYLIQVKRRAGYKSEGVEVVRNLLGTMLLENALRGIVISTADHFTYRAYEAVGRASERGMVIDLIDRGKLARMLNPLLPKRPWRSVVDDFDPSLNRYFMRKFYEAECATRKSKHKEKRKR